MNQSTIMREISEQLRLLSSLALGRKISRQETLPAITKELTELLEAKLKAEETARMEFDKKINRARRKSDN